jgi:hypothetical protein
MGHDIGYTLGRITQTDQSGHVGLIGQPGQLRAGQDRVDGMPGNKNKGQALGTGELWSDGAGQLGQDR